ncbi:kunitz-type protease inhibitor 1-like [Genypterus blacodes]|uniref:kunitz-type protease inhibitor 1-like n=1 Tax=Genypterus blacodes TaxID=154954 RepID=UPI003F770E14
MLLLSSSSLRCLVALFLLLRASDAEDEAAECGGNFHAGQDNFVLDAEDAVNAGAAFLSTGTAASPQDCVRLCCGKPRCNLALLDPPDKSQDNPQLNRTCALFDCLHRNRFVCRFVNQPGFQSFIRKTVFEKHLQGPGDESPPIANAGKDVVVQLGQPVLLNGIESLALGNAHIKDYSWTQLKGDASLKMEVTDHTDQVRLSDLKSGSYVFKLTVTDSNDQTHTAKVAVLVLGPDTSDLYCLSPVKVGPCRAAFPRWHFNAASGSCEQFSFGGCKPNHNNYVSKEECVSACSGVKAGTERSVILPVKEVCGSPCLPTQLVCGGGCCLDRTLECDGLMQCSDGSDERHCSKLNHTFTELLNIDVNKRRAQCTEPPHTGPCRASHVRWYYDPLNRNCHRFTYGGCNPNSNNFEKEDACSERCKGVTERHVFVRGVFQRYEDEEESISGSVALAVVLSVAILALLAILTYCFLRSRKQQSRRPVNTGSAPVMLSEQDTLVYNATTKPA